MPVIAATGIAYRRNGNRLQRMNIYLRDDPSTQALVGTAADSLPARAIDAAAPAILVHVHGGAWRDPQLTATSITATVAHAFHGRLGPIQAIASLDYTISPFPSHPDLPYDPETVENRDPAREARHPQHVSDILKALALLRTWGMSDGSYILSGHSCGACIAAQAVFGGPERFGLDIEDGPRPAAFVGLNGLYDLPALFDGLGPTHEHLHDEYRSLLSVAFGDDSDGWANASPALFDPKYVAGRVKSGRAPQLIQLEQSAGDQLVPLNQRDRLTDRFRDIDGLRVVTGRRCTGPHAAPWQHGSMIWDSVCDAVAIARSSRDISGGTSGRDTDEAVVGIRENERASNRPLGVENAVGRPLDS